jgi:hypothetical protein
MPQTLKIPRRTREAKPVEEPPRRPPAPHAPSLQARLKRLLQRAVYRTIGLARTGGPRVWYRLTAPPIEAVDRGDVRPMFAYLRAHSDTGEERLWRPEYVWGVLTAAWVAKGHGIERISAIEFGVAGGNGLVALENAALGAESLLGVKVDVYGFDTGRGNPKPVDHRDAPFAYDEGDEPMDVEKLRARLGRAELVLGHVADTVPEFLEREYAPVGFISNEMDFYSSTMHSFGVLDAPAARLIPRVICHFVAAVWHPGTDFVGPLPAIHDFNQAHDRRKISPIHGLRYTSLPRSELRKAWPDKMFVAEIFDHELYKEPQGVAPLDERLVE